MAREGVEALLLHGGPSATGPVHYLSGYLPMRPTWMLFALDGPSTLFLRFHNHVPKPARSAWSTTCAATGPQRPAPSPKRCAAAASSGPGSGWWAWLPLPRLRIAPVEKGVRRRVVLRP
jgi:hypothetical protein